MKPLLSCINKMDNLQIYKNAVARVLERNKKMYRHNPTEYLRTCFHIFGLAHHLFLSVWGVLYIDLTQLEDESLHMLQDYGIFLLTTWNMVFQVIFFQLAVLCDLWWWRGEIDTASARRVKHFRDVLFTTLVVPFSMLVGTLFWLLYNIDRELVFPAQIDRAIPQWYNHGVHTTIIALLAVEIAVQRKPEPSCHGTRLKLCWLFSVLYAVVYYTLHLRTGIWLYPVFGLMNLYQICLFQSAIWSSQHLFYVIQWPIMRFLHSDANRSIVAESLKSLHAMLKHYCKVMKEYNTVDRRDLCVVFKCNRCLGNAMEYCVCN